MRPDTSSAIDFLTKFSEDKLIALTSIVPDGNTTTRTFDLNEKDAMSQFIESKNRNENIYFSVNPVKQRIDKKGKKEDIKELAWLHVDIDPTNGKDLEAERKRIFNDIKKSPLKPTAIVDSGNGYQIFWCLITPIPVNGNIQELEIQNKRLENYFQADSCHNIDRIMRVPGTLNHPSKKKRSLGRKLTVAKLVYFEKKYYSINDFSIFGDLPESKTSKSKINYKVELVGEEETWEKFHALCKTDPDVKRRWEGDDSSLNDTSRSGFDMSMISLLKWRGFSYSETQLIMGDFLHGKNFEMEEQYFKHSWDKAKSPPIQISSILNDSGISRITENSSPEQLSKALKKAVALSKDLSSIDLGFLRSAIQKIFKNAKVSSPAEHIKRAFPKIERDEEQKANILFEDPIPFDSEVDGQELLDEIRNIFKRFIVLPENADVALTLWVLFAWAHDAFQISPLLDFRSPTKRCGKTTALKVLSRLVPRPLSSANISTSALFRSIEQFEPTLIIDEVDTFLENKDEIHGVLNAGHERDGAYVLRVVGDDHKPKQFCVWAPKIISGIGRRKDTLEDRSIRISMERKSGGEKIERLKYKMKHDFSPICAKALRWANDHIEQLKDIEPELPNNLNDRAKDNWEPLIAIADLCGGEWPEIARKSALAISGDSGSDDDSETEMLLEDIQTFFNAKDKHEIIRFSNYVFDDIENSKLEEMVKNCEFDEKIPSNILANYLGSLEERPWPEYQKGKRITTRQIATILKRFGVEPRQMRINDENVRGYFKENFQEAFTRYLSATNAT